MHACDKPKTKKTSCSGPAPNLLQSDVELVIMKTRMFSGVILPGEKQIDLDIFTGGRGHKETYIIHHSEELDFFG